jgi:hypothetical protein
VPTDLGLTPLHWAVVDGFPDFVREVLAQWMREEVTSQRDGSFAILAACEGDSVYYFRRLCRNPPMLNARTPTLKTP